MSETIETKDGDTLYREAINLLLEGKDLPKAMHYFNQLFNYSLKDPTHSDSILFHLGACASKLGYKGLAVLAFKNCIVMRDDFHEAYNNLGCLYKAELLDEDALLCFQRAYDLIKNKPDKTKSTERAEYVMNIGSMYIANGTPQMALAYFNESETIDSSMDMNKWNRSLAHLELGDYEKGWDEYDHGERVIDRASKRDFGIKDLPFWDGVPDKSKTIVVSGEQGIGDEIMFASMLPDMMKDVNVIIEAHPRLADLFRGNFPDVPVYGTRKDPTMMWPPFHQIDGRIHMGSLGKFYRRKIEDFPGTPYLVADPKRVEKYKERFAEMGERPKIGISWRGGIVLTGKRDRHIPLELWLPILQLNCDFISLQYDKDIGNKIKEFEVKNGLCLNHWQDTIDDYDETAAMVSNLDLIISVPQSVVHLAGALGKITWQLAPYKALWQVGLHGKNAPWYRCVRNIWQDSTCKWEPVMEQVRDQLCSLLQMSTGS